LQRLTTELAAQQSLLVDVQHCLPNDLAAQCTSARLRDDTLVLHVNSAIWATRIRFLVPQLAGVLRPEYPALRNIKVRLQTTQPPVSGGGNNARQSASAAEIIHDCAAHANSEALRQSLQRLARAVRPAKDR
jgi:hypothetical protein